MVRVNVHVVYRYSDKYPASPKILVDCDLLHYQHFCPIRYWLSEVSVAPSQDIWIPLIDIAKLTTVLYLQQPATKKENLCRKSKSKSKPKYEGLSSLSNPYNALELCWLSDIVNFFFCQASCVRTRLRTSPRPPIQGVVPSESEDTRVSEGLRAQSAIL